MSSGGGRLSGDSPRSMMNIACRIDQGSPEEAQSGVLESELRFEEQYSVGTLKVVATVREGLIPVRVFNPLDTPRRIYRGSPEGDVCPLLETEEAGTSTCYRVETPMATEQDALKCQAAQPDDAHHHKQKLAELFVIDNPSIPADDKDRVYDIIARHSKVASWCPEDLGHVTAVEHSINTGDVPPIRVKPRRLPFHRREEVRREAETIIASDVIEPSTSP